MQSELEVRRVGQCLCGIMKLASTMSPGNRHSKGCLHMTKSGLERTAQTVENYLIQASEWRYS